MPNFRFIFILTISLFTSSSIFSQVEFTESNLPIVIINTNGLEILHDERIVADMGIIYAGYNQTNHINDPWNNYNGKVSIETRGNTSLEFPKKSYSFETQDENGGNLNVSLAGLPIENDWVLYGPFSDKSLMRNVLTYELARRMGRYAPRTRFCEVILNGEYMGVSVLTEKIKQDDNRLDIAKITANDTLGDELTGGYILRIDRWDGVGWLSPYTQYVFYELWDPDDNAILPVQLDYIHHFVDSVECALYNMPETHDSIVKQLIDIDGFCDYIISNELSKNVDAYRLSAYLYKDKDSKDGRLKMGPLWDYNIAYGNCSDFEGYLVENFIYSYQQFYPYSPFYIRKLMEQPFFQNNIRCRWDELRKNVLSTNSIDAIIDSCSTLLNSAQERNFQKWDILGQHVWPNYYIGEDYNQEIEILKDWIHQRLQWIDIFLPGNCPQNYEDINKENDITIYPNPFVNKLHFTFNLGDINQAVFQLFDSYGQLLIERTINHVEKGEIVTLYIDYESVSNGFYFWQMTVNSKRNYSGKLIRQK